MSSEKDAGPHFCWVAGIGGAVSAQIWHVFDLGVGAWKRKSGYLRKAYPITEEETKLPLETMARLYQPPPPAKEEAA